MCTGDIKGAFASHYVANHLQDEAVSGVHHSTEPNDHHHAQTAEQVNSTRNLANLSRLFRQSQPLYNELKQTATISKVMTCRQINTFESRQLINPIEF